MSVSDTALVVVDVQESFRHRPYFSERDVAAFTKALQALIDGARSRGIPVVQIFHVEETGAFSLESGHVVTLRGIGIEPDAVFRKHRHSALVGTGLDVWLVQHGVRRVIVSGIRTEQCCETTTRHLSDSGYEVDFVTDATLTFPTVDRHGRTWSADDIKARTELALHDRFARVATVEEALSAATLQLTA